MIFLLMILLKMLLMLNKGWLKIGTNGSGGKDVVTDFSILNLLDEKLTKTSSWNYLSIISPKRQIDTFKIIIIKGSCFRMFSDILNIKFLIRTNS